MSRDRFAEIRALIAQGQRTYILRRRRRILALAVLVIAAALIAGVIGFFLGERTEQAQELHAVLCTFGCKGGDHRQATLVVLFHLGNEKAAN